MTATTTPYAFIKRGNLFITPVGPSIAETPYPTQPFTKPPEYSLWVHGKIHEPGPDLDRARMSPALYQEVRSDLVRFSPVEVTRSAIRRSEHAYVGVIDSLGTPYYFALDSRGVSVRKAEATDAAFRAFDRLAEAEHMAAVKQRRQASASEMRRVDRELSDPRAALVVTKGIKYGRTVDWKRDVPNSTWWRNVPGKKEKRPKDVVDRKDEEAKKSDGDRVRRVFGHLYASRMRRASAEIAAQVGEEDLDPPRPDDITTGEAMLILVDKAVARRAPASTSGAERGRRDRPGGLRGPAKTRAHNEYKQERVSHEAAGGVAVGRTRIRPSGDQEARSPAPVPHFADRPEHVIGGPGHRVAGEPEHAKPRGTTSLWKPGDDERRAGTHAREREHRRDQEVAAATAERIRSRGTAGSSSHGGDPPARMWHAREPKAGKRGWLSRLLGKGQPMVVLPGCWVRKALPRGGGKKDEAKKTPSRKVAKKQLGAGGKTRYTYPQEKKGGTGGGQVPLVVTHDDTRNADPVEFANQLGVSMRTLQRTARHLGGDGFASFMRSRLKRFAAKHQLDPDYWNTLYANLMASDAVQKSDGDTERFGRDATAAAASVPEGHPERFGDRKVFIHHVHNEMKKRGTYSGSLDDFKKKVVRAHQNGHLVASRADLVAAMNHHSVSQSETKADGATFHFIQAKHDPNASVDKTKAPRTKVDRGEANIMSQRAREATARANSPESHLAAMAAHHHAGVAHQRATGRISDKTALSHFDQATAHHKASKTL